MLRDAEAISDDSRIAENAEMAYIDYETVRRYRNRFEFKNGNHIWNNESDNDFLKFLGAAGKDKEGVLRPTYAGLLMFGQDCWITRVLPQYFLDFRQETSSDMRWEDRFTSFSGDWSGNVYDFYNRVYNKLKAALKVPFRLEGIERVDETSAHEALREAIINCITNANYHERRGVVCVWKDEALMLANPGDFRIPLERAMQPGESDPRNATMLKMFSMIDAGERAGSGISKILHGWEEAGYAAPTYSEEYGPDRTILTLPLHSPVAAKSGSKKWQQKVAAKSGSKEYAKTALRKKAIIDYLSHGSAKSADIAQAIDLGVSRTNTLLKEMVQANLVCAIGESKARRYRLAELDSHAGGDDAS